MKRLAIRLLATMRQLWWTRRRLSKAVAIAGPRPEGV